MTSHDQLLPPGFRFHPTDEELIVHYLKNRAAAVPCPAAIITDVDIYKFDPWELPAKAAFGDKEWYFFSPRDRKYPNGVRPNRAAGSGYWKATGTDKPIVTSRLGKNENIGVKKALVFYKGKPPKGRKTNWIMHEYRLADMSNTNSNIHLRYSPPMKNKEASMRLDDWVLCRIYEKSNGQTGAPAADDQFEVDSSLASFSDLGNLHNRMQLSGDLFADTDYHVLSRVLLHDNPPDLAGQEQLLSHMNLNPTMNQPRFDDGNCANGTTFPFTIAAQLEPSVSMTSVGGGLKRQRVADGSHDEHEGYPLKNISSFMSSIDTPQLNAMNQSFFLSSHFGFQ